MFNSSNSSHDVKEDYSRKPFLAIQAYKYNRNHFFRIFTTGGQQHLFIRAKKFLSSKYNKIQLLNYLLDQSLSIQIKEYSLLKEKVYISSTINHLYYLLRNIPTDIIAFDVDETLITSADPFYQAHICSRSNLGREILELNPNISDRLLFYLFRYTRPWAVIEHESLNIITELQAKNQRVIALTAIWPLIDEDVALEALNWRIEQLISFGFNFKKNIPIPFLYNFYTNKNLKPYFRDGVLYSNLPKGEAFAAFLKSVYLNHNNVVFIDDNPDFVRSVYYALSQLGINCICILYTRIRSNPVNYLFNEQVFDKHLKLQEDFVKSFMTKARKTTNDAGALTHMLNKTIYEFKELYFSANQSHMRTEETQPSRTLLFGHNSSITDNAKMSHDMKTFNRKKG